jgi:hypothetical protein
MILAFDMRLNQLPLKIFNRTSQKCIIFQLREIVKNLSMGDGITPAKSTDSVIKSHSHKDTTVSVSPILYSVGFHK